MVKRNKNLEDKDVLDEELNKNFAALTNKISQNIDKGGNTSDSFFSVIGSLPKTPIKISHGNSDVVNTKRQFADDLTPSSISQAKSKKKERKEQKEKTATDRSDQADTNKSAYIQRKENGKSKKEHSLPKSNDEEFRRNWKETSTGNKWSRDQKQESSFNPREKVFREEKPDTRDNKQLLSKKRAFEDKIPLPRHFPKATELFVKNIDAHADDKEIFNYFKETLGDEACYFELIVANKSRGIGYLGIKTLEKAQSLLNLNESLVFREKELKFSFSSRDKPKEEQKFPVFVGNISFKTTEQDLLNFFKQFKPSRPRIITYKTGKSKGFGYIDFSSKEDHDGAIGMSNKNLHDRELNVNSAIKE